MHEGVLHDALVRAVRADRELDPRASAGREPDDARAISGIGNRVRDGPRGGERRPRDHAAGTGDGGSEDAPAAAEVARAGERAREREGGHGVAHRVRWAVAPEGSPTAKSGTTSMKKGGVRTKHKSQKKKLHLL